ncbi:hypothetical protein Tco_0860300 [Tanacetum coccineum]|uniref:Reverse transcriptase domain-containing protein n=1 Tax=Tanacetum coccineum TaxID=301880 RepID=A0ABQ5BHI3_9ASTR
MRTRSQSRNQNRPQQQAPPVVVEPFNFEEPFDMAANGAGGAGPPPAGGGGLPVPDLQNWRTTCGTFMKRRPKECYDLIKNMTAHHNDWDTSAQRNESSSSITSSNPEIASLKLQMEEMNRNLTRVLQTNQQVNTVTLSCETCGGPHSYNDYPATIGQNQNVYAVGAYN